MNNTIKFKGIELEEGSFTREDFKDCFCLYDLKDNGIYYENSNGYWAKWEYDLNDNPIYIKHSNGYWVKREYDENNNEIYREDSEGKVMDNRGWKNGNK